MNTSRRFVALIALATAASGAALACGSGDDLGENSDDSLATLPDDLDGRLGIGTDQAASDECLSCHGEVDDDWQHPSTHRQLLDCFSCHTVRDVPPGPGHAERSQCTACHSQAVHSDQSCTTCHNQHGSSNAYLIRTVLTLPDGSTANIHFTRPEGASADGLVRAGVDGESAGTGLCEVCHDSKRRYYNRDGNGAPHETTWCANCHKHSTGFDPVAAAAAD